MNAKLCKKLRKIVKKDLLDRPECIYVTGPRGNRICSVTSRRGFYLELKKQCT